jgi:hypothetical protein
LFHPLNDCDGSLIPYFHYLCMGSLIPSLLDGV